MFKILVIDDTNSVHSFIQLLVSKVPEIQLAHAYNGAEGFDCIAKGEIFQLVLLDWEMPVLNGPDTFQKMKSSGMQVPTLMMTTKNQPADIQKMLSMGVAEYMMKPFDAEILFQRILAATGEDFRNAA